MTRPRLPFILTPLAGEAFDSWFEAYAARLHTSTGELATAVGLPHEHLHTPIRVLLTRRLPAGHLASVATATGLTGPALAEMFHRSQPTPATARPNAARAIHNAWAPAAGTRFCPTCLAENGGRFPLAWRLPFTFLCLRHNQLLADACPPCGRPPRARTIAVARRPTPGHCGTSLAQHTGPTVASCSADLATAAHPALADPDRARRAQLFIDANLARAGAAGDSASPAAAALTDLSVIALHLATPHTVAGNRHVLARMLHAGTLVEAVDLLTHTDTDPAADPLTALVQRHTGTRASAVPESWGAVSPALATRIIRGRDPDLGAPQRIRRASTLPAPPARPAAPHTADPALTRTHRIPDQIWSAWALRLLADDTLDPIVFRQAAAVALLLPGSSMSLAKLAALTGPKVTGDTVKHQLAALAQTPSGDTALRIITELGVALDHHRVPIDYARRRRLALTTELIDPTTWKHLVRAHHHFSGGRRRLSFARTYLYELLTAGSPAIAPAPYTVSFNAAGVRAAYHDFVLNLPAGLAEALAQHARRRLTRAGITDEPLQWQPPTSWITVTSWPGVDPDSTDPEPLHHALRHSDQPAGHIAQAHGMSLEHLRHVIRGHPIPGRTEPRHRPGTILPLGSRPTDATFRDPHVYYVDLAWLQEQYLTWHRTFADIAAEIGCKHKTLGEFAKQHGVPRRPRGGGRDFIASHTAPAHPADLPQPLRAAFTGRDARQRIDRFLLIAETCHLGWTAQRLGATTTTLSKQLADLEHRCGGQLFHRRPRRLGGLTPLGQQLRKQAQHHLDSPAREGNGQLCRPSKPHTTSQVDR